MAPERKGERGGNYSARSRAGALLLNWLLVISFLGQHASVDAIARQAQDVASCATTTTGYTVEICLIAPAPETTLTSDVQILAEVEVSGSSDAKVHSVEFTLNDQPVLTDYHAPYQFMLPVAYWGDGSWTLAAAVRMNDKVLSSPATTTITIGSGPPLQLPQHSFVPTTGRAAKSGEPFVVAAVGDSAGGSPVSADVANLIASWDPNLMLYLGDVYDTGSYTEFMNWYDGAGFMGQFRDITLPSPGNHEYSGTEIPQGYMEYWGNPPRYYSVDTAGWHIVSLDTNKEFGQLSPGSDQMEWLIDDLSTSNSACTLVFFHHPPFSVGAYSSKTEEVRYLWQVLADNSVTLVLAGHDHNYQRWHPLDTNGNYNPYGTVSIVVGTGGHTQTPTRMQDERIAGPVSQTPGALQLELDPNGAIIRFVTTGGIVEDIDGVSCNAPSS